MERARWLTGSGAYPYPGLGGHGSRIEEVPAAGGTAAREEGESKGKQHGEGGDEDTGAGEAVAEMDVGAAGAGPVPQEEDLASVQGVGRGAPRHAPHAGGGPVTRARRLCQPWAPREARR